MFLALFTISEAAVAEAEAEAEGEAEGEAEEAEAEAADDQDGALMTPDHCAQASTKSRFA